MTERVAGHRVHWMASAAALLEGEELEALVASIREHGQQEEILARRVDGELEILDGRNRLIACKAAGVEPVCRDLGPLSDAEAEAIVEAAHCRRHESKSARALRAYKWLPRYGNTQAAAKACGVSAELVRQVQRVAEGPDGEVLLGLVEAGRTAATVAFKAQQAGEEACASFVDRLTSNNVPAATALREAIGEREPSPEPVSRQRVEAWVFSRSAGERTAWLVDLVEALLAGKAGEAERLLRGQVK